MVKLLRLLAVLVVTAIGCVYPELKMEEATGGDGGTPRSGLGGSGSGGRLGQGGSFPTVDGSGGASIITGTGGLTRTGGWGGSQTGGAAIAKGGSGGGAPGTRTGGAGGIGGTTGTGTSTIGNCPDLSGSWRMAAVCGDTSQVGDGMTLAQKGCTLTVTAGVSTGWTGSVSNTGAATFAGQAGSESMLCTGTASGTRMILTCNSSCVVAFTRPLVPCRSDNDCGSGQACDSEAAGVNDGYCTPFCDTNEECPALIECPGMVARTVGDCTDPDTGKGYCDQYQWTNGPTTCSEYWAD